jgi:hypothetical protein
MKALLLLVAGLLLLGTSSSQAQEDNLPAPPPPDATPSTDGTAPAPAADDGVTFQTFYDALSSQGTWIQSPDYGYVWQPNVTDPNWAPYTVGHWVYTADGWTWASDEPWGWATYHYGRWTNIDGTGWVWVPGYTWAPAWVSWRYGDGYAGWAPLPPDSLVGIDYSDNGGGDDVDTGYHIGADVDDYYGIGAGWYVFLPWDYLGFPSYRDHYCRRGDNYRIINHTNNVTNINVARNGAGGREGGSFRRVTTGGPNLAQVNSVSQTPIARVSLVHASQPNGGGAITNNSLALFAPHVRTGTNTQPAQVLNTIGQAVINRGTDITRPMAVNGRIAPTAATEAEVQQARLAQSQAPANAKVLGATSSVRPVLQAPLGSLRPMARAAAVRSQESVNAPGTFQPNATPGSGAQTRSFSGTTSGNGVEPGRTITPGTSTTPGERPRTFQQTAPTLTTPPSFHPYVAPAQNGGGTQTHSVAPAPTTTVPAPASAPAPGAGAGDFRSSGTSSGGIPSGGGAGAAPSAGSGGGGGGFGGHNH